MDCRLLLIHQVYGLLIVVDSSGVWIPRQPEQRLQLQPTVERQPPAYVCQ